MYKFKAGDLYMVNAFVAGTISLVLAIIMIANVFMPVYKGANTTNYTSSELQLWNVLGLAVIIGVVVGAFQIFGLL